ncbi:hypothetical protein CBS101457_000124 [Exobasidium rhododendri]|nr:hypothetical protein CBS101457_000124 [Exobasidium rhododendri]
MTFEQGQADSSNVTGSSSSTSHLAMPLSPYMPASDHFHGYLLDQAQTPEWEYQGAPSTPYQPADPTLDHPGVIFQDDSRTHSTVPLPYTQMPLYDQASFPDSGSLQHSQSSWPSYSEDITHINEAFGHVDLPLGRSTDADSHTAIQHVEVHPTDDTLRNSIFYQHFPYQGTFQETNQGRIQGNFPQADPHNHLHDQHPTQRRERRYRSSETRRAPPQADLATWVPVLSFDVSDYDALCADKINHFEMKAIITTIQQRLGFPYDDIKAHLREHLTARQAIELESGHEPRIRLILTQLYPPGTYEPTWVASLTPNEIAEVIEKVERYRKGSDFRTFDFLYKVKLSRLTARAIIEAEGEDCEDLVRALQKTRYQQGRRKALRDIRQGE